MAHSDSEEQSLAETTGCAI